MNKIIVLIVLLVPSIVLARPLSDVYADGKVVFESVEKDSNYQLALGVLKKVNAEWITEKERTVFGTVFRTTTELEPHSSETVALKRLEEKAKLQNGHLIFACDGLDCGSSNAWANTRFEIKQLYGMDQSQSYRVWEFASDEGHYIGVGYTVRRGNKRVYAQVDVIAVSNTVDYVPMVSSAKAILTSLDQQGYFVFRGYRLEGGALTLDAQHIEPIVKAMRSKPLLKLKVVGHDYLAGEEAEREARSIKYAQQLIDALIAAGAKSNRLTAHGVGGLAPQGMEGKVRIVLIAQ